MSYLFVGLGNPGIEYEKSRHNAGRMVLQYVFKKKDFPQWQEDAKGRALVSKGELGRVKTTLLLPETFMNKSGSAVSHYAKSKKAINQTVVIYDDIDLPLGKIRISFGRGSGGNRGVESIIRSLKSKDFIRLRVGIAPTTPSGKLKKPKGEKNVIDFLMKGFRKSEEPSFKKVCKHCHAALSTIVSEGKERAMNRFN